MICKKDIIEWFQKLESYKRIDIMCTLLNMCLPFELRFLGTCLEELGRRDSQDLRGVELRVNNQNDLKADFVTFQTGEPTDMKVRRRMALYLALMRACNRTCVSELFKALESWGNRDFEKFTDAIALQELLLVYTMGNNHPVFSFEQKMKCGEIFTKIALNDLVVDKDTIDTDNFAEVQPQQQHIQQPPQHQHQQQPQQQQQQIIHQAAGAPHTMYPAEFLHHLQGGGGAGPHQAHHPIQLIPSGLPVGYPQAFPAQMVSADGNIQQHQLSTTLDGLQHHQSQQQLISSSMINSSQMAIPSATDLSLVGQQTGGGGLFWTQQRPNTQQYPPSSLNHPLEHHPPQSASPLLSQQSSPANSRSTSPSRSSGGGSSVGGQTQQLRNIQQRTGIRNVRRSSNDTTPPPPILQQQQILDIITAKNSDAILTQNSKNHEEMDSGHYAQLQQLIRNGYRARPTKSGNVQQPMQQHQQQIIIQQQLHHPSGAYNAAGLPYAMQNMSLSEIHSVDSNRSNKHSNTAGGSESCSSNGSAGETSPPETPTILSNNINTGNSGNVRLKDNNQYGKQINFQHINGRPEKVVLYAPPVSPQQVTATGPYEMMMIQPNTVVSNNNTPLNSNAPTASCNNNLGTSTVLIPSHQPPTPQQFGNTYPYPAAVNRPPPLLQHVTGAPPGTFRIHNGEGLYYQPHYPVFVTGAAAPTAQHQAIRSSPSQQPPHSLPTNAATTLPPQLPQPQPTVSPSPVAAAAVAATLVSPYSTILPTQSGLLKSGKPQISCYNCGSQNHTGRDCQEASMEEVTRGAVYKLDYSSGMGVNISGNSSNSNSSNNNLNSSNNNIGANTTNTSSSATLLSSSSATSSPSSTTTASSSTPSSSSTATVVTTIDITSDTTSSTASSTSSSSSLLSTSNNK